jgi:hypothetical protein
MSVPEASAVRIRFPVNQGYQYSLTSVRGGMFTIWSERAALYRTFMACEDLHCVSGWDYMRIALGCFAIEDEGRTHVATTRQWSHSTQLTIHFLWDAIAATIN